MTEFTLALALVDFIPVVAFGIAIILLAGVFNSPLFLIGAVASLLAGVFKVLWKLILGTSGKDIKWLNRSFLPLQAGGWLVMLLAVILNIRRISFPAVLSAVSGLPQLIFFILWLVLMGTMVWYKKNRFDKYDAKTNWVAEIVNSLGQCCFLAAMLFAVG
ncbi:MAG: hypothetical protein HUJ66_06795 [Oscillospiraceae bacterium]|nr:hypothetical protein [Oscillospiraceae bacterium]